MTKNKGRLVFRQPKDEPTYIEDTSSGAYWPYDTRDPRHIDMLITHINELHQKVEQLEETVRRLTATVRDHALPG